MATCSIGSSSDVSQLCLSWFFKIQGLKVCVRAAAVQAFRLSVLLKSELVVARTASGENAVGQRRNPLGPQAWAKSRKVSRSFRKSLPEVEGIRKNGFTSNGTRPKLPKPLRTGRYAQSRLSQKLVSQSLWSVSPQHIYANVLLFCLHFSVAPGYTPGLRVVCTSVPLLLNAANSTAAKQKPQDLDVDEFLNGGFLSMDAEPDQLSESAESESEAGSAHDADMASDAEQDVVAAAAEADSDSDSDGE